MKLAIRITRWLYVAFGLAAGYLLVYIALNAYLFGFSVWVDGAAVTAIVVMLAHQPLLEWTWEAMKRRFVRRRFGATPPTELPVWDRSIDYPAKFVLPCCGLIFESTVPTGPGYGNVTSPLDDGQRVWKPL